MNTGDAQIMTLLKDFETEIKILKKKQSDLLQRVRKTIDIAKLDKIKKSLAK